MYINLVFITFCAIYVYNKYTILQSTAYNSTPFNSIFQQFDRLEKRPDFSYEISSVYLITHSNLR